MDKKLGIYAVEQPREKHFSFNPLSYIGPSSHSYLALVDQESMQPVAEIHFAGFSSDGEIVRNTSRVLPNLIACFSPSRRLDNMFLDFINARDMTGNIAFLKGKMTEGRNPIGDYDHQLIEEGNAQDMITLWEQAWRKACIINTSETIFTCAGIFRAATNCRAATEALTEGFGKKLGIALDKCGINRGLDKELRQSFNPVAAAPKDMHKIAQARSIINGLRAQFVEQPASEQAQDIGAAPSRIRRFHLVG